MHHSQVCLFIWHFIQSIWEMLKSWLHLILRASHTTTCSLIHFCLCRVMKFINLIFCILTILHIACVYMVHFFRVNLMYNHIIPHSFLATLVLVAPHFIPVSHWFGHRSFELEKLQGLRACFSISSPFKHLNIWKVVQGSPSLGKSHSFHPSTTERQPYLGSMFTREDGAKGRGFPCLIKQ